MDDELVRHRLLDVNAAIGNAGLTHHNLQTECCLASSLLYVGVFEYQSRAFSTELQYHFLEVRGGGRGLDLTAGECAAGEVDQADVHMR